MRFYALLENSLLPRIDRWFAKSVLDAANRHGFGLHLPSESSGDETVVDSILASLDHNDPNEAIIDSTIASLHHYMAELAPAIHGDKLRIFRAISVSSVSTLRTDAIGRHWSTKQTSASPYNARNPYRWVVIEGLVNLKDIDWADTMALHLEGGEYEVELLKGTPVTIVGAEWHNNYGKFEDDSAQELIGKTVFA